MQDELGSKRRLACVAGMLLLVSAGIAAAASPASNAAAQSGQDDAKRDGKIVLPIEPPMPNGKGHRIGQQTTTTLLCHPASRNGQPGYADTTTTLRWEYTRDSNGDGSNDADPAWVRLGMKTEFVLDPDTPCA